MEACGDGGTAAAATAAAGAFDDGDVDARHSHSHSPRSRGGGGGAGAGGCEAGAEAPPLSECPIESRGRRVHCSPSQARAQRLPLCTCDLQSVAAAMQPMGRAGVGREGRVGSGPAAARGTRGAGLAFRFTHE